MVDLGSARPQRHLEAVALVDAGGERLVEAAMLGLGLPIRAEIDGFADSAAGQRHRATERDPDAEEGAGGKGHRGRRSCGMTGAGL